MALRQLIPSPLDLYDILVDISACSYRYHFLLGLN